MDRAVQEEAEMHGGQGTRTLYVLGYHKIGEPAPGGWETWFYIPERIFEQQLMHLRDQNWDVIDMAMLLRALEKPDVLPERAVLLTFDDGCRSMHRVALPWLRRFGFPAVLFVPSDYVGGRTSAFDPDEPDEPLCGWNELQELEQSGISVESHSATHRHLSQLSLTEQLDELIRSKAALEARLKKRVEAFAYPYGDCGADSAQINHAMHQAGYRVGFVYGKPHGPGPNKLPFADPFRLKRVPMGPEIDLKVAMDENV